MRGTFIRMQKIFKSRDRNIGTNTKIIKVLRVILFYCWSSSRNGCTCIHWKSPWFTVCQIWKFSIIKTMEIRRLQYLTNITRKINNVMLRLILRGFGEERNMTKTHFVAEEIEIFVWPSTSWTEKHLQKKKSFDRCAVLK